MNIHICWFVSNFAYKIGMSKEPYKNKNCMWMFKNLNLEKKFSGRLADFGKVVGENTILPILFFDMFWAMAQTIQNCFANDFLRKEILIICTL